MPHITHIGRVMVPVSDQDEGIAFYTQKLGFTLAADVPFGDGDRWVEVAPPNGGANLALVPPRGDYQPGRNLGLALVTADARAAQAALKADGVDVDDELIGGAGTVPPMFFFRDHDGNHLLLVETQD
jgi:catechol 2,3-dioxygenase-like lactoylglutathione lyase family enzyme